jgi:hypothetical protein
MYRWRDCRDCNSTAGGCSPNSFDDPSNYDDCSQTQKSQMILFMPDECTALCSFPASQAQNCHREAAEGNMTYAAIVDSSDWVPHVVVCKCFNNGLDHKDWEDEKQIKGPGK